MHEYLCHYQVNISAVTVLERVRGYSLLWRRATEDQRKHIESARTTYLGALGRIWPFDGAVAVAAGEIMALLPDPPTPPHRSHRLAESRQERLARWRFDGMVAATALVAELPLIHNNAADFEAITSKIRNNLTHLLVLLPKVTPLTGAFCGKKGESMANTTTYKKNLE